MPAKKTQLTDAERAKRIRETARKIEVSESHKAFDEALKKVLTTARPAVRKKSS